MIVNNFCFLIVFTRPTSPHDRLSLGLGQLMRLFPQFLVSILYRNRTQYVTFQVSRKTYIFIIWEVENQNNPMWFCVSPNRRLPFTNRVFFSIQGASWNLSLWLLSPWDVLVFCHTGHIETCFLDKSSYVWTCSQERQLYNILGILKSSGIFYDHLTFS